MSSWNCKHRQAIRRATTVSAELQQHAQSCSGCRKTLLLKQALLAMAEQVEPPPRRATAHQIWWRAQVVRRLTSAHEQQERAGRPLRQALWVARISALAMLFVALNQLVLARLPELARTSDGQDLLTTDISPLTIILVLGLTPLVASLACWLWLRER